MDRLKFLSNISGEALDELYAKYILDAENVDEQWRNFFKGFEFARTHFRANGVDPDAYSKKEFQIINLIHAYRQIGRAHV